MIPLRDINPRRRFPLVTVVVIAANIAVFLYAWMMPSEVARESLSATWGLVPYRFTRLELAAIPTVVTSMFLHGGLMHLAGNMLYLWIFGDNIEAAMGSVRFVIFYLLCGTGAALAQVLVDPASRVPMIGASGAISGVLGAYLLLYPRVAVETLLVFGFLVRLVRLPSVVVLGWWIVLQLASGLLSLGMRATGGVAWFAHVGGFAAGMALAGVFRRRSWGE